MTRHTTVRVAGRTRIGVSLLMKAGSAVVVHDTVGRMHRVRVARRARSGRAQRGGRHHAASGQQRGKEHQEQDANGSHGAKVSRPKFIHRSPSSAMA